MAYKLFDRNGNIVKPRDLQDKGPWCVMGESFEKAFIKEHGKKLGLVINPEKTTNKFAVDLFNERNQNLGDLKIRNTPFFEALTMYSINPQYAVTFNEKDFLRYYKYYSDFEIYYWIDWLATRFEGKETIEVKPMTGVWKINLFNVKKLVVTSPLHSYQQRIFDNRANAKKSYVFDLSSPFFEKVI
jgi:hypothetical protein